MEEAINTSIGTRNTKEAETKVLNQTSWDFKRNMGIRFRYFEPVTKIDRQKVNMECGSRIFLR
ncbi:hypothetical protein, partial [Bacillus cereus]